jgi:hypothetical protein
MNTVAAAIGRLMKKTGRHGHRVDEPAADEGSHRTRGGAEPGPRAHGAGAVVGVERRRDDGQAARHQQRAAGTLQRPRRDQHADGRRQPAEHDAPLNPMSPSTNIRPPAVEVAQRPTEQQHRGQGDEVGVERPLLAGQSAAEVVADVGQRHVDDGGVEERDPGPGDGGRDEPAARGRAVSDVGISGHGAGSPDPEHGFAVDAGGPSARRRRWRLRSTAARGRSGVEVAVAHEHREGAQIGVVEVSRSSSEKMRKPCRRAPCLG